MKQLKKNKFGFNHIYPLPNLKSLNDYYKNKYFKNSITYKNKFRNEEEDYLKCISLTKIFMLNKIVKNLNKKNLLDLGAGQGTFLIHTKKYFKTSLGVDFSISNLIKKNKSKVNFISENPELFIKRDLKKFDVITLNNVLEHVPNPILFMKNLKKNIRNDANIILTIPNDFSDLQKETNKRVKKKDYWLCPPEHLNYFNKKSFINFSEKIGFKINDAMAEFPIELFLLKKNFDYTKNPKLGKNLHLLKCEIMSYLYNSVSIEKIYFFLKIFYELNIGRDNIFLLKKK